MHTWTAMIMMTTTMIMMITTMIMMTTTMIMMTTTMIMTSWRNNIEFGFCWYRMNSGPRYR